jgi:hypothetical protein
LNRLPVFAIMTFSALLLAGCRGGDPSSVTRQFIDACNRNDSPGAEALLTKLARQNTNTDSGKSISLTKKDPTTGADRKWNDFVVGSASIDGDNAIVPVTTNKDGKSETVKFKLRREDGAWRIFALIIPISPGNEMTLDLEHPESMFAEMFKALPQAMEKGTKALGDGLKALGDGLSKMGSGIGKGAPTGVPSK